MSEDFVDVKPWWQSRAVVGALVAIGAGLVGGVDAATQAEVTNVVLNTAAVGGAVVAIVGRVKAKKRLKLK